MPIKEKYATPENQFFSQRYMYGEGAVLDNGCSGTKATNGAQRSWVDRTGGRASLDFSLTVYFNTIN